MHFIEGFLKWSFTSVLSCWFILFLFIVACGLSVPDLLWKWLLDSYLQWEGPLVAGIKHHGLLVYKASCRIWLATSILLRIQLVFLYSIGTILIWSWIRSTLAFNLEWELILSTTWKHRLLWLDLAVHTLSGCCREWRLLGEVCLTLGQLPALVSCMRNYVFRFLPVNHCLRYIITEGIWSGIACVRWPKAVLRNIKILA